ncbi:MAG: hypothetical protein ABSD20_04320 [Terriglobales bacterium]|jgi:hypothetical protein
MSIDQRKHALLVRKAEEWLRRCYRCGIVLSEQYATVGEIPDVIGWRGNCRSVVVECKVSRGDFLADANKPCRTTPDESMGCERFFLTPPGLVASEEVPKPWGLLEYGRNGVRLLIKPGRTSLRSPAGLMKEMNLLLASLRRVEIRIEPQTITDFLKWRNRMVHYNGGIPPVGLATPELNEYSQLQQN